jgi:hypothetical protein
MPTLPAHWSLIDDFTGALHPLIADHKRVANVRQWGHVRKGEESIEGAPSKMCEDPPKSDVQVLG